MFTGQDYAKQPGLPLLQLERFLDDIRVQPIWRPESDRCANYYDNKQVEPWVIQKLKDRGQPVIIHNLIAPAIDGVLGIENKTRVDWLVQADDDQYTDFAEAINQELNEAARLAEGSRACSDAHAAQVKTGLGWVEVNRNIDPFEPDFRINYVHRREIFWDWHDMSPDLKKARWLLRRRWLDEDEAENAFPNHKELIKAASRGWNGYDQIIQLLSDSDELLGPYTDYSNSNMELEEWCDSERRRILAYEVYYRVYDRRPVMKSPEGIVIVYDANDPIHNALVATGRVEVNYAPFSKMRLAYFLGPHRVIDVPSPHPHNTFPYVPFWGFREDTTGIPYGLIRRMLSAQDEINFRRSKLTWLLNAKRIIKDEDAVLDMTDEELAEEVNQPDSVITLNPDRKNRDANAFRVETDFNIASQQFQIMLEAERMINECGGIYNQFLGKEDAAKSGVAIDALVEQGTVTLSEILDNFRFAYRKVGELLLYNVIQKLSQRRNHQVIVNSNNNKRTKRVVLNQHIIREGKEQITNEVTSIKTKLVLSSIASSPGYRAQISRRLMELAASMPEQLQAIMLDLVIDATDIPEREEIVKRIRQFTGQGQNPEDMTDEQIRQQQIAKQKEEALWEVQFAEMSTKVQELSSKVRLNNAKAEEMETKVGKTPAEIEKIREESRKIERESELITAQMKKLVVEMNLMRREYLDSLDSAIASQREETRNSSKLAKLSKAF